VEQRTPENTFLRIVIKGFGLFIVVNLLFGLWAEPEFGKISLYNRLFPGRERFPFGESPREAFNFSLFDLDAMFASHQVSAPRPEGEFRVFLLGDSSIWGTLLRADQTLAGQLNAMRLKAADGRVMRFYNLGYPTISLTKDLMILEQARSYDPDLVIWLTTLEAFPRDKQLSVPLIENNPAVINCVLEKYHLPGGPLKTPSFFKRTLIGRRKALADLLRLQIYGMMWSATGIDQVYPADYPAAQVDLEANADFHGQETIAREDLAFDVIRAGQKSLGDIPLLVVNEPMLISQGVNSDIRYNYYYPRWVYDQYRAWMQEESNQSGWNYVDAWNLVSPSEFTNSAIHMGPKGVAELADRLIEPLLAITSE
jgi:hypothetical protein